MRRFEVVEGVVAPIFRDDVDTDTIIPVSRMKAMDADFGAGLFANLRYRPDGSEDSEFVLNRPAFRRATILVAGSNFGCGSSREQAVWALEQFGIRAILAAGFGDIFYDNCIRRGILPVRLEKSVCAGIAECALSEPGVSVRVDLASRSLTGPDGLVHGFWIEAIPRQMLLEGLDAVAVTLLRATEILAFQGRDRQSRPWIYTTVEAAHEAARPDSGGSP